MKLKFLLSPLFCCLFSTALFAQDIYNKKYRLDEQKGYVVTQHNDTMYCMIRPRPKKWKIYSDKSWRPMDTDTLKSFYLVEDSVTYEAKSLPSFEATDGLLADKRIQKQNGQKIFIEKLIKGHISLYETLFNSGLGTMPTMNLASIGGLIPGSASVKIFWYACKVDSDLIEITPGRFKNAHKIKEKERIENFMAIIAEDTHLLERFKEAMKNGTEYTEELIQYYIKTYNEDYLETHTTGK